MHRSINSISVDWRRLRCQDKNISQIWLTSIIGYQSFSSINTIAIRITHHKKLWRNVEQGAALAYDLESLASLCYLTLRSKVHTAGIQRTRRDESRDNWLLTFGNTSMIQVLRLSRRWILKYFDACSKLSRECHVFQRVLALQVQEKLRVSGSQLFSSLISCQLKKFAARWKTGFEKNYRWNLLRNWSHLQGSVENQTAKALERAKRANKDACLK